MDLLQRITGDRRYHRRTPRRRADSRGGPAGVSLLGGRRHSRGTLVRRLAHRGSRTAPAMKLLLHTNLSPTWVRFLGENGFEATNAPLDIPRTGFIIPTVGMKRASRTDHPRSPSPGLADALFAKVQQRVLGVLFGNPRRSFYANEVIRLARSGTGAVQRELARLEASDLVTVTRVGKQKHYQANAKSPLFEELRALVLKTVGLADVLRAALAPMTRSIRAENISQ